MNPPLSLSEQEEKFNLSVDTKGNRRLINGWKVESMTSEKALQNLENMDINDGWSINYKIYFCLHIMPLYAIANITNVSSSTSTGNRVNVVLAAKTFPKGNIVFTMDGEWIGSQQ